VKGIKVSNGDDVTTRREEKEERRTVSLTGVSSDSVELNRIIRRSRSVDGSSLGPVERVLEGSLAFFGRVGEREDDGKRVELGHSLDDRLGESSFARGQSDESSGCRRRSTRRGVSSMFQRREGERKGRTLNVFNDLSQSLELLSLVISPLEVLLVGSELVSSVGGDETL